MLGGVGLGDRIDFLPMDSDGFDTIVYPEVRVNVPRGWAHYLSNLIDAVPGDAAGLTKFVRVMEELGSATDRITHGIGLRAAAKFRRQRRDGRADLSCGAHRGFRGADRLTIQLHDLCHTAYPPSSRNSDPHVRHKGAPHDVAVAIDLVVAHASRPLCPSRPKRGARYRRNS